MMKGDPLAPRVPLHSISRHPAWPFPGPGYSSHLRINRVTLCPPNPKELLMAILAALSTIRLGV
jgi:hypothetical protein